MLAKIFEVEFNWFGSPVKYKSLGERELRVIPSKGDCLKGKDLWNVLQVTHMLDVETQNPDKDYVKIYVKKADVGYQFGIEIAIYIDKRTKI